MQNLSCLVPKEGDGGALYTSEYCAEEYGGPYARTHIMLVPKPLKHLILTREAPIPTPPLSAPPSQPSRRPQPLDRLKHAFAPIGSEPVSPPSSTMDIDQPAEVESPKKKQKRVSSTKTEVDGTKKNKGKGKPKDKKPQPVEEAMEVDDVVEVSQAKKPKKKASRADVNGDVSEAAPKVKKEKKKRKAEEE